MNEFEQFCEHVSIKFNKNQIESYWISEDFSHDTKMVEITDKKGNAIWYYFDKKTGALKDK